MMNPVSRVDACAGSVQAIGVIALSFLSTGCLVGPNYQRPQMPSPQQFRFVEGAQAESLADVPWFKVFDDPALQELIKTAIANNLDLSEKTVKNHVRNIFHKLQVYDRTQAAILAIRKGLIELDPRP